jgi:hypothetical protein
MQNKGISRREFLAGTALVGATAALGLAACEPDDPDHPLANPDLDSGGTSADSQDWLGSEPVIEDSQISETIETEVVIIGAGTGGMFAACATGELGIDTVVLEKFNGGVIRDDLGAVNSRLQQANGYTIDKQAFLTDMYRYANGQVNIKLYEKWFDNSAETIDWYDDLLATHGVKLWHEHAEKLHDTLYPHWATGHSPQWPQDGSLNGMKVLTEYAEGTGHVTFMWQTPMVKLVVENNKVVGAIAQGAAGFIRVNASKATIVATGGYGYNQDMMNALQPQSVELYNMNAGLPGTVGDGHKACLWAGAKLDQFHTSMLFDRGGAAPDSLGGPSDMTGDLFWMGSQPWLKVNLNGQRFCNESGAYDFVLHASATQPGAIYCTIWDSDYPTYAEQFDMHGCSRLFPFDNGAPPNIPIAAIMGMNAGLLEKGYIQQADTIEELAQNLGIPAANLVATVNRNNQNFDNKNDPDFFKEPFRLSPVRQAPFYGIRQTGMLLCTLDGIVINEDSQALREDGSVIDGLYVIGDASGCYYATTYPNLSTGNACGRTVTFARQLAKSLA